MSKKTDTAGRAKTDDLVAPFVPDHDFVGKPFGPDGPEMHFRAGIPSSPVPKAFIDAHVAKKAD